MAGWGLAIGARRAGGEAADLVFRALMRVVVAVVVVAVVVVAVVVSYCLWLALWWWC